MGKESIGMIVDLKPLTLSNMFSQALWWRQKTGEWIRIEDMSPGHRYNTAAMIMRNASRYGFQATLSFAHEVGSHDGGEMAHDSLERALDEMQEQVARDPRGWMRETVLYRALTDGLTVQGDGTEPHQKTGRDPITGEPNEVLD